MIAQVVLLILIIDEDGESVTLTRW
jgi:hypothetical protein